MTHLSHRHPSCEVTDDTDAIHCSRPRKTGPVASRQTQTTIVQIPHIASWVEDVTTPPNVEVKIIGFEEANNRDGLTSS